MALIRGFDVSAYQGATVPSGADFIIVKATEGSGYTSSRFAPQWESAKGRAKHRGAYCFARPEESSAASQAARFLDVVRPVPGESVWLDLEASDLSQAKTNAWACSWGDYIRQHAPDVTSGVYLGRAYAANNTGRGLAGHFMYWWMPQYPSTARTSTWPTSFRPAVPSPNNTGWSKPHIWQWTDNFNSLDANLSWLTLEQLAGGGQPTLQEEDVYGGIPPLVVGHRITRSFPKGSLNIIGIVYDSPNQLTYRVAAHSQGGGGKVVEELVVGGPASDADKWPKKKTWKFQADADWLSVELVKGDPSVPDANGKVVEPGWDASHTA